MTSATIAQINIYPVKSVGGISVSQSWADTEGLAFDRRFMLAFTDGGMVTARKFPQMVKVRSAVMPDGLVFQAQDCEPLRIRYQDFSMEEVSTTVWKDTFAAYTTTNEANDWFSHIIGRPVKLLFTGEHSHRYRESVGNTVGFADGYPLLVISQGSLDELNRRSPEHHLMEQFRTNLVVSGTEPFAEDSWKRIRIGEAEFEIVKPCSRCILTTVDVKTGQLKPTKEPLKTLSQFRSDASGDTFFGQNLAVRKAGMIQAGDVVEVLEYKEKEHYPDNQPKRQTMTCVEREEIARDFVTFWLEPQHGQIPVYQPGQHLPIELIVDGEEVARHYTLSSSPSRPGRLAISVKRMSGGQVSNWLLDNFQIGDVLQALDPNGQFHLQSDSSHHPLLLLSAGSGVTPMLSMLRYLADHQQVNDVVFYHQCRSVDDIPCREELEQLNSQYSGLKVIISLTQPPIDWFGLKGRFSLSHLRQVKDVERRQVFVCGPDGFMQKARNLLMKAGLPANYYHQEAFGAQKVAERPHQTVTLTINGQTITGNNQQTLLEQAEDQGIAISNSCRAGLCGSCRVKVTQGQVSQPDVPALGDKDRQAGMALACCCVPDTDLEVSY
ncbi:hybrid-cluster NAD(P)-dependent oxidoreductase [Vibrio mangrovi]|uniref:Hybrid-cluster NAD(P)-dependent oxidoreductase n=1 Tax=Vibrio mangrovi TaxID=474394 RepID=A0A1Y6IZ58_9VIBR|nr:hybrid-cluster NAD(P)-dependent oxidoreductase [Vibrio mangrovi]MDW6005303.1 hybrid-cluster NAD(P)-dependent oxidoreductase [Vibrio mangrovi]SMS02929.1 Stearoyl-CoA 9-desaturase electron transfer partner [Vibrio mangrovi]